MWGTIVEVIVLLVVAAAVAAWLIARRLRSAGPGERRAPFLPTWFSGVDAGPPAEGQGHQHHHQGQPDSSHHGQHGQPASGHFSGHTGGVHHGGFSGGDGGGHHGG